MMGKEDKTMHWRTRTIAPQILLESNNFTEDIIGQAESKQSLVHLQPVNKGLYNGIHGPPYGPPGCKPINRLEG